MLVVSSVRQLQPLWWWLWWGLMEGTVVSSNGAKRESEATQSRLTLCDSMAYSLPGLSIHGIFQAKVLEWVAISFSRGSSWPRDQTQVSCIAGRRFTLWTTREAQQWGQVIGNQAPESRSRARCLDISGMSVGLTEPGALSHGLTSCDGEWKLLMAAIKLCDSVF